MESTIPPCDPKTYLSISDGMCRIVHLGQPLCADTPDKGLILAWAARQKLELAPVFYNGDKGQFDPMAQ